MMKSDSYDGERLPVKQPGPGLDMAVLIDSVDQELTSTLLRYSGALPASLIKIGKSALAAPGKVMAFERVDTLIPDSLPQWPLFVLLSCQAATLSPSRDAWMQALPAAVAVEIA